MSITKTIKKMISKKKKSHKVIMSDADAKWMISKIAARLPRSI